MSGHTKLFKNSILNILGYVYLLVVSFVSIPLLSHGLGTVRFAEYLLLAAIPAFVSILDFGLSQAVVRYLAVADLSAGEKRVLRENSLFFYLVSAVWVAVATRFAVNAVARTALFHGTPLAGDVLLLLVAAAVVNQVTTHYISLSQAEHRFDIFNIKTLVVGAANTIIPGYVAVHGASLSTIFAILLAGYVLTLVLVLLAQHGQYLSDRPRYDAPTLKKLLNFGLRTFVGNVSGQVQLNSGKYVMAGSLSGVAIAAYSIPQSVMYKAAGGISQGMLAVYPVASSLSSGADRARLRKLYHKLQGSIFVFSLVGVVLAYAIGQQFLFWWLHDTTLATAAFPILRILSYFFVVLALTPIASMVMDGVGFPQYTSAFSTATAILNLVLLLVLVPRFGVLGAAYATLLSSLVTTPVFLVATEVVLNS